MTEEIKFLCKHYALLHFISVSSSLCTQFWLMLLVGITLALLHLSVSFHKIITRLLLMIIYIWCCAAFIIIYRSSYEDHLVKSIDHCVQIRGSTNSGTLNPVSSRSPYTWYNVVIIVRKYRNKKKKGGLVHTTFVMMLCALVRDPVLQCDPLISWCQRCQLRINNYVPDEIWQQALKLFFYWLWFLHISI